ncbi:MAG TPA: acyl carrier protein [Streptosporangiaceae bacterium]|nr:acyl carrier protein [Streptosporangiaceae bacterium]
MYEELRTLLIDDLQLNASDLRPEVGREEAGLDSLAVVELSMLLSDRFRVEISDEELLEAATVADIAHLLEQQVQRTAGQQQPN